MLFILAGHETTASTLQFFWYQICMNPAVQNQIYEEIQQKEKFNYEDIRDFKVDFSLIHPSDFPRFEFKYLVFGCLYKRNNENVPTSTNFVKIL